jgi:inhibitor of cysteine peptidase
MIKQSTIKLIFFIILFIAISLYSCAIQNSKLIQVSEKDEGSTLKMIPGDTLELVLKTNPSTGYGWKIVSLDTNMLTMIQSQYIADKVIKNIVGSGGKSVKLFKALKKGESLIKLVYQRPFEEERSYIKKFTLTVIIQ